MTDIQEAYYPPLSFLFELYIAEVIKKEDWPFQEIGGLKADIKMDEGREKGIRTFSRKLPQNVSYSNLV